MMRPPQSPGSPDCFQTPPIALEPLYPHLKKEWIIWEPACGTGQLSTALAKRGFTVRGTDIIGGFDFLTFEPEHFDCIVTNPPYSLKEEFLKRCYALGKPFALLLPLTALEGQERQPLFEKHGVEIIIFDKRINFVTPEGKQASGSWFMTAWFTWGLNIGKQLTFAKLRDTKQQVLEA